MLEVDLKYLAFSDAATVFSGTMILGLILSKMSLSSVMQNLHLPIIA
jgi:hypothetical protein